MSKSRPIDPNKGFRIDLDFRKHSNVLPTFAQSYHGNPEAKSVFYPNAPDVKNREGKKIKSLDEFRALLKTADPKRIADSIVVFGTEWMSFREFFIRESRNEKLERFHDLYNRVGKISGGDLIPCAMLFKASEEKTVGLWRTNKSPTGQYRGRYKDVWVKGQELQLDNGTNVDFELYFSYLKQGNWQDFTVREGQLILVTGMAERSFASSGRETIRVYVDHKDAMRFENSIEDLLSPPEPEKPYEPTPLTYEMLGKLD
jgi:hypothetical protein